MESWWINAYPDQSYRQLARIKWEKEITEAALTGKVITPHEFRVRGKNGAFHTVLISGKFIEETLLVVFYDITDRKNAETLMVNALTEAERLRKALDIVPSYLFIKDKNLNYTYANRQTLTYFGTTADQLHQVRNEDIFPAAAAASIRLSDEEVLQGKVTMQEVPIEGEDGAIRLYMEVKSPIREEVTNEIIGIVGISTDITEQKELAQREKTEREKLQIIASRLPGMIYQFRMRPDGSVSFPYVSDAIREIYELEPEAVKDDASAIFKNIHPEDLEKGLASIQLSASTLKPWIYEYRYLSSNGAVKYLKGNALPLREDDGSVLWHGFINDVTEIKMAEIELNKTLELNNNILKMVPAGIFWKDRQLRYIGCNDVFIQNLGIADVSAIVGKDDFILTTKEAAEKYRNDDMLVLKTERPLYGLKEIYTLPDGRKKHILTNKTPLRNTHGEVIGVLGSFIDITALTEAEEMLQTTSRLYLLISQLNQMFIRQNDESTLLQETCNMAIKYGGFLMAWIGKPNPETGEIEPLFVAGNDDGYLEAIKGISFKDIPEGKGPTGTSIREKRIVYTEDIALDPLMFRWRQEALKRGYRSMLAVPIFVGGEVAYSLSLYSAKPSQFTDEKESILIKGIAEDLSFSLNALHIAKQKQQAEKRVEDYTYALNESAIVDIADSEGRMFFANENFYRITGYTKKEIMGQDHRILNSGYHDKRVYKTLWSTVQRGEVWRGELRNKAKDGRLFWVDTTIVPFLDENRKPFQFISIRTDITERKNAEAEKLLALERFELLTQSTSDTIWDWDVKSNVVVYSQGLTQNFGYKQRVIQNNDNWHKDHVHPDDWDSLYKKIQRVFRLHRSKLQSEYRFLCADGTYKFVQDRAFVIYDEHKNPVRVIGSIQDVTKEKELNQQIENAVIRAQEKEWHQLGMELHDNVNQILAASIIFINFAQEKIKSGKDAILEVSKSEEMIRSAIHEIRRLSHQLAPASVEQMNIRQVIETLAEAVAPNQHFKIHLNLEQTEELPMTPNLQTQLYRILQEQFNNIIKHAHAKNVTISLRKTDHALVLKVIDDGRGMDATKAKATGGIGLENIRRRVTMFGGTMRISTAPGKGYSMEIDIPLSSI